MDLPFGADRWNARSPRQPKQPLRPESWPGMFIPQSSYKEPVVGTDAIVKMSFVCSKCRPIREWLRNSDCGKIKNRKPKVFQHHESGLELKKRYLKGCHLCTLIWQSMVEPGWELWEKDRIRKRKTRLTQLHKAKNVKVELRHASGFVIGYPDLPIRFRLRARLELSRRGMVGRVMEICSFFHSPKVSKSLQAPELDPKIHPYVLPCEIAGLLTSSIHTLDLASTWIKNCVTKHQCCNTPPRSSTLPSRLVEIIGESENIRIRVVRTDQSFQSIKYAALSYCWGKTAGFQLKTFTARALGEGINLERLHRTLQDAIKVAHKLGLKWIWIDSLCILQDSADDWTQESARMTEIYGNCYVCIAAAAAASSSDGIFSERDPLIYQPCRVPKAEGGSSYYILPHNYSWHFDLYFDKAALQQRGWVVQERILSPRTVYFGSILLWECREEAHREMGLRLRENHLNLKKKFWSLVWGRQQRNETMNEDAQWELFKLWSTIICTYTEAHITFASDRLTAIKGIVDAFALVTGWHNFCGLWEPFMLEELLWKGTYDNPKTPALRWPTWSWTAVMGGTYHRIDRYDKKLGVVERVRQVTVNEGEGYIYTAVDVSCVKIEVEEEVERPYGKYLILRDGPWSKNASGTSDLLGRKAPQFFLPLAISCTYNIMGIGVVPSETVLGGFERVGYYESSNFERPKSSLLAIFSDRERYETVTLV